MTKLGKYLFIATVLVGVNSKSVMADEEQPTSPVPSTPALKINCELSSRIFDRGGDNGGVWTVEAEPSTQSVELKTGAEATGKVGETTFIFNVFDVTANTVSYSVVMRRTTSASREIMSTGQDGVLPLTPDADVRAFIRISGIRSELHCKIVSQ